MSSLPFAPPFLVLDPPHAHTLNWSFFFGNANLGIPPDSLTRGGVEEDDDEVDAWMICWELLQFVDGSDGWMDEVR